MASSALALLLALMLVYGCRAFDPAPVIVNRPPDTFITGAPAETTGTRFLRHMYWYGTDVDGEVVRYIYAITDSTVRDASIPDEDEEDQRFNPAEDVTTLVSEPGRFVGWTTRTDSIFLFEIDREFTPSKDITFHVVSIDDRGAVDPTPARLHFFNNSLGNPTFRFRVLTLEDTGGLEPEYFLRWVGDPKGNAGSLSPEGSSKPFVGFARPFRIEWEASSPNGAILGYRYKASQDARLGFIPPADETGEKQWDPAATYFDYANEVAPEDIPGCENPDTGENCPPATLRWPNGSYSLAVSAIDQALVESEPSNGELTFEVNYPPETRVVKGPVFPFYLIDDGAGGLRQEHFSEGDTIPSGAYAVFQMTGFDRLPSLVGAEYDSFCCDVRLDPAIPEVRFQGQTLLVGDEGNRTRNFSTLFSEVVEADTLGFFVGPFAYAYEGRTQDEHGRPDPQPNSFTFVGGFRPMVTDLAPPSGARLILRDPSRSATLGNWPENDVPYSVATATLYWDGVQYLESDCGDNCDEVNGHIFRFRPRFQGAADESEPGEAVRAWAYSLASVNDVGNLIDDGPGESRDLSFYNTSPEDNLWDFSEEEAVEIFVPSLIWILPGAFDNPNTSVLFYEIGQDLRKHLGNMTLRVRGRTTTPGMDFKLYLRVRPGPDAQFVLIDIERMGRRSDEGRSEFEIYLGLDPQNTGNITRYWPDY